ncbi:MAG: hypothetical protein A3E83_00590 [Gammaproteobacteria bacterium RIFCSPHIGHO2_12_FULL_41_20]|nr:MAG: hypothetical protein A3E83_00590 [Gammaproteobacteria bacterium RIFCSPHIGHO2_12_FULL_41_20]
MHHTIWVIVANSSLCRFYLYEKNKEISLLKEIVHPENKLKKSDYLTSDKPGHYKTDAASGSAYESHTDPKKVAIDNFAREIAKALQHGRTNNEYQKLIIIIPPTMHGLLFQHLDKHVKNLISHNIQKDVIHLSHDKLLSLLHSEAYG